MRITAIERGTTYTRDSATPYKTKYTQPIHNYIHAWLYHYVWEKLTWRIYRKIEIHINKRKFLEDDLYVPLTARQDERCFDLSHRNRKEIK